MGINFHKFDEGKTRIDSAEAMYDVVKEYGIIPFFENVVPGYSVEELTAPQYWFDGEDDMLGPWDWKIELVRSGDIAYGKFLLGGKAAFATVPLYRELMNYRRSLEKYRPKDAMQQAAYDFILKNGSASVKDLRLALGLTKGRVDAILARLQMDTLVITGDIERVYRGPELKYNGWQHSSFCTPDALFADDDDIPFFAAARKKTVAVSHTPEESYRILSARIKEIAPAADDRDISRILG